MRRILLSLILLLALATPVVANLGAWRAYEFSPLDGGLNNSADPTAIGFDEANDLQNVVFDNSGGVGKRNGFQPINSSAACSSGAINGLYMYRQADATRYLVAVCADDTIQKMDYGAGTSGPDGTWDAITGALSFVIDQDNIPDFATVQNTLVIEDGLNTTAPYKWSGTGNATALGGSPPNATMVEFHKRILWLAGRSDARSRVDFSNLDDFETYTATDFILVETDDNQIITGIHSALDCLYVFKTESIWRICGGDRDNLTLEQMVRGIGAASNEAIELINNRFVFLTTQGDVALYDGGINVQFISSNITETLSSDNVSLSRFQYARSTFLDDVEFYLSLSSAGSGTHDLILLYDVDLEAWTKFSGINANALATYEIGTQERNIMFGDYSGFVHQYPTGNSDNGSNINAFYQSGHLKLDIPSKKTFREVQLILRQEGTQNITFERRIDFVGSGTATTVSLAATVALWDTAIWDASSYGDIATQITRIPVNEVGDFFQWRIEDDSTNPPFLLRSVRLWAEPEFVIGGSEP